MIWVGGHPFPKIMKYIDKTHTDFSSKSWQKRWRPCLFSFEDYFLKQKNTTCLSSMNSTPKNTTITPLLSTCLSSKNTTITRWTPLPSSIFWITLSQTFWTPLTSSFWATALFLLNNTINWQNEKTMASSSVFFRGLILGKKNTTCIILRDEFHLLPLYFALL